MLSSAPGGPETLELTAAANSPNKKGPAEIRVALRRAELP